MAFPKLLIASLLLPTSLPAWAANDRAGLPSAMSCVSGGQLFRITQLNAPDQDPELDRDGGLMEMEIQGPLVKLSFSNECDNFYEFVFFRKDLEGTPARIHGLLRTHAKTAAMTCTLTR